LCDAAPSEHSRDDWRGAALAAALGAFVRTHGALMGSRPFLRGWRVWLEAQQGESDAVVWRLRPEALTQAGGPDWARDAVALLRAHALRRHELELRADAESLPQWCVPWLLRCTLVLCAHTCVVCAHMAGGADQPRRCPSGRLVWALPPGFGDDDIRTVLAALPSHRALEDVNATGEVVRDTSPAGATQRARVTPKQKALRACCCFGPALPFA
jgi:hypothetical protein